MAHHQFTAEETARGVAARKGKPRKQPEKSDGVGLWRDRTPQVLQAAVVDVFHGRGTDQQRRLVDNWWRARLYDTHISKIDLLAASLDASRRGG